MSLAPTTPSAFSIRRRLLLAATLALGAALVGLAWLSALSARQAADSAFDRLLAASALTIAGAVQAEDDRVTVEVPFAALSLLGYGGDDRIFYQVLDLDGAPVTGYADLGRDLPAARLAEPLFSDATYRGEALRVVTVGRLIALGDRSGWVTVRVGQTRDARRTLGDALTSRAVWALVALAALALLLLHLGVQRALRPLRTIESALRRRAHNDLSPLREPVPAEVGELVGALNEFMTRLSGAFTRLNGLLADAAHQLRTPLASLRAQSEIALEETDPQRLRDRLGRIHANAVQAGQMVSQVLMDATVMHRLESRPSEPVAAARILDDVLKALDADAASRVSSVIEPAADRLEVSGDRVALREMVRNLVENALAYSRAPVDIVVRRAGDGRLGISVEDRGPGIPDAEKALVMERFRRGSSAGDAIGSGLGLSIADAVARGHGGTLALADRPGGGLVATVVLPADLPLERGGLSAAMALAVGLVATLLAGAAVPPAQAAEPIITSYPVDGAPGPGLVVAGTTDRQQFEPLIRSFQHRRAVAVTYLEYDTNDMQAAFLAGAIKPAPDLLISSAIDLQVQLANDGHTLSHVSAQTRSLPAWARWRDEVFGFTFEPAVIVYNKALVPDPALLRSRTRIIRFLAEQGDVMRGKVATYDIVRSGVGHLLAAQDAEISSTFWQLASALGEARVLLMRGSGEMIDRVDRGELAFAYNVLGPYAAVRAAKSPRLGIVVPQDYALVLSRAMVVPRTASRPDLARAFVDHVLSAEGQRIVAGEAGLGAILGDGPGTAAAMMAQVRGPLQPIPFSAALLTFLDQRRRAKFLQTWLQIIAVP